MKRLCYGVFAKILLWSISKPKFQTRLHILLLSVLEEEYAHLKVDPAHASRWFNCHDDVTSALREAGLNADIKEFSSRFEKSILPLVNPNKLQTMLDALCEIIRDDYAINADTIIDSINNVKKKDLPPHTPTDNPADFLAGAFAYAVVHVDNKEGKAFAANINDFLVEFQNDSQAGEVHKIAEKHDNLEPSDSSEILDNLKPPGNSEENDAPTTHVQYIRGIWGIRSIRIAVIAVAILLVAAVSFFIFTRLSPRTPNFVMIAAGADHTWHCIQTAAFGLGAATSLAS